MNSPKLLIFDLDGTLIDSRPDISHALNSILAKRGLPQADDRRIAPYIGTGVRALLAEIAIANGQTDVDALFSEFDEIYAQVLLKDTKLYPGILDVLEGFDSTPKVVLSNKYQRFIEPILVGLGIAHFFVDSYGRDAFAKMKPDPLPVLLACKRCGVEPKDTLVIGDTATDIRAAKAAQARSCAVLYGYGDINELRALKPEFLIDHAQQLFTLF